MLFNTIEFVVFFVVVLAAIVIVRNRSFQHLFLLAASYFFFYFSSNYLLSLLIISTILDFYVGKEIWKTKDKTKRKLLLSASLDGNLGLLGFFNKKDKENLDKGLEKTKGSFFSNISKTVLGKSRVDEGLLDELEGALIASDVGVETTVKIINRLVIITQH